MPGSWQPLAFSKELLPVGSYLEGSSERPRAVSEYLVERMVKAGVDKICFVISPGKADILNYFGAHAWSANVLTRAICLSVNARASMRHSPIAPIARSSRISGTERAA